MDDGKALYLRGRREENMSKCGICLDAGCDFGDNSFEKYDATFKTPMKCCECEATILPGIKHERAYWVEQSGKPTVVHTCGVCAEIAWAFFCETRVYHALWEYMEDVYENFTVACFNKLKTPEAKAELQSRWMRWKGFTEVNPKD